MGDISSWLLIGPDAAYSVGVLQMGTDHSIEEPLSGGHVVAFCLASFPCHGLRLMKASSRLRY